MSYSIHPNHFENINIGVLNQWVHIIEQGHDTHSQWMHNLVANVGLERNLDILLLSALLPDLTLPSEQHNHIPLLENILSLSKCLQNGIDLTDPRTLKELDILDLQTLFEVTKDKALLDSVAHTLKEWLQYKKQYGTFLQDLQQSQPCDILHTLNKVQEHFSSITAQPYFYLSTLIIPITELLERSNISYDKNIPMYLDAIVMQILLSSQIIVPNESTNPPTGTPMDWLLTSLLTMQERTGASSLKIIRILHQLHSEKRVQTPEQLNNINWIFKVALTSAIEE